MLRQIWSLDLKIKRWYRWAERKSTARIVLRQIWSHHPTQNADRWFASLTSSSQEELDEAIQRAMREHQKEIAAQKIAMNVPDHVPSVKSSSDFQRNQNLNVENIIPRPAPPDWQWLPTYLRISIKDQGENPIHQLQNDALLEEIRNWKSKIKERNEATSITEKIVQALQRAEDLLHEGPKRGE